MWERTRSACLVKTNKSCGTHIHLSPLGRSWTLEELKSIAIAINHFESAFEVLLPMTRRGSPYARSNRRYMNSALENKGDSECIEAVLACQSVDDLATLMCTDRYVAWNFVNLKKDYTKGTLEWRQPPGQNDAVGCLAWIELALNFVHSAASRPTWHENYTDYTQTIAGLQQFISEGIIDGVSQKEFMEPLFIGKSRNDSIIPTYVISPLLSSGVEWAPRGLCSVFT